MSCDRHKKSYVTSQARDPVAGSRVLPENGARGAEGNERHQHRFPCVRKVKPCRLRLRGAARLEPFFCVRHTSRGLCSGRVGLSLEEAYERSVHEDSLLLHWNGSCRTPRAWTRWKQPNGAWDLAVPLLSSSSRQTPAELRAASTVRRQFLVPPAEVSRAEG